MGDAKSILLKPISRAKADTCVRDWHYSGKPYPKSQLHFGVYYGGELGGVLAYGDPLDRRKVLGLVKDTPWGGMVELNRMALAPHLPKNCESRALAVSLRLLKKYAPQVQWALSFADATQCGDGTIYRASGWLLTQIKGNTCLWRAPSGEVFSDVGLRTSKSMRAKVHPWLEAVLERTVLPEEVGRPSVWRQAGLEPLQGHQLRYLYPLRADVIPRMTVPSLPYSAIAEAGAGMYLGEPRLGPMEELAIPSQDRQFDPDPEALP